MRWTGSSLRWRDGKQPVWGRLPWTPHLTSHTHTSPPSLLFYSLLPLSSPPSSPPSLFPSLLPPYSSSSPFLPLSPYFFSPSLFPSLPLSFPSSLPISPLPPSLSPPSLLISLPQVAGEDEGVREKAIEYVSSSLMSMRHHLFIPHPDNEKHLMALVKKVRGREGGREREGKVYSTP